MAKQEEKSEISEIKKDLNSLKSNVIALTKSMQEDGKNRANAANESAKEQLSALQARGKESIEQLDEKVREKPTQSLLAAFGAGVVLSLLIGRRG